MDGEFQVYENKFRFSNFHEGLRTNRQIHEQIEIDKLKCWGQKTVAEFWIYEQISANLRQISVCQANRK